MHKLLYIAFGLRKYYLLNKTTRNIELRTKCNKFAFISTKEIHLIFCILNLNNYEKYNFVDSVETDRCFLHLHIIDVLL